MHPILIQWGPVTLRTYGLMMALGFTLAIILALLRSRRYGIDQEVILDLGFYIVVSAIIGARLFYVFHFPDYFGNHPWRIFKLWEGGLVFYGGLLGAVLTAIIYLKIKKLPVMAVGDLAAPSISLGQAIGRLGCFFAGCCYGQPHDGPCSLTFTDPLSLAPLNTPLHPVQLYSAGANLAIFLLLLLVVDRWRKYPGQVFLAYLTFYPTARFLIEFLRGDDRGFLLVHFLSPAQVISLAVIATAMLWWLWLAKGRRAAKADLHRGNLK